MRRTALALAAGLAAAVAAAGEPPLAEALERIGDRSTLEITTIGRASGKPRTTPIWFVVADDKILVQAGKGGKANWYLNLEKTPRVRLRVGGDTFEATATAVTEPSRVEEIHGLFLDKYTSAWLLSFVGSGIGRGAPVELTPTPVAAAP